MPYLDTYTTPLTARTAAHLLRRATFGPTQQEISDFTGLSAEQAVDRLISNVSYTINADPPVDLGVSSPTFGQPFMHLPYSAPRNIELCRYVGYWWVALMCQQNNKPSVLEKLTFFWQNHFVVSLAFIGEYRLLYQYLKLLRNECLGNFREMAVEMSKNAAMLLYQNGNENSKTHPNENYARELQELFVVGQKDFKGNSNYTEDDVKAAARVLTGWQVDHNWVGVPPDTLVKFNLARHDTLDKTFSEKYNNRIVKGKNDASAGQTELNELINMLLGHPESPKFICRKLYRWYVNSNVTQDIEDNVIVPLANIFSSAENDFRIEPILRKLLTSQVFFDNQNIGSMIKAPTEYLIGSIRFFNQPVPNIAEQPLGFKKYIEFIYWGMTGMQLDLLNHITVFGFEPYYQTGFSKNWINGGNLMNRIAHMNVLVYKELEMHQGYILGIDILAWVRSIQPNFSDVDGTPAIDCEIVFEALSKNLYSVEISKAQMDFIIDTVMLEGLNRIYWKNFWNGYRRNQADGNAKIMLTRLMRHLILMAEYHIF